MKKRNGNPGMSPYDWDIARGKFKAGSAVCAAKARGDLPYLRGDIPCADCGNPATDYDHRDYNRPLDVEPVCRRCNLLRGPAIPHSPLLSIDAPRVAWNRKDKAA